MWTDAVTIELEAHYRFTCSCRQYKIVSGYDVPAGPLDDMAGNLVFGAGHQHHLITKVRKIGAPT